MNTHTPTAARPRPPATATQDEPRRGARLGSVPPVPGQWSAVLGACARLWRSVRPHPVPLTRACVCVTKDGATVRGVLYRETWEHLLLARCEVAEDGARGFLPVDGDLLVYKENVRYLQLL